MKHEKKKKMYTEHKIVIKKEHIITIIKKQQIK